MRVDIEEAQGKLSELIGKVVHGGENHPPRGVKIGTAKGEFTAPSLEEFDSMNDEIAEMFGVK